MCMVTHTSSHREAHHAPQSRLQPIYLAWMDVCRGCLSHIRRNLGATLRCAEECAASMQGQQQEEERGRPPLDLVANGVWKPLQQVGRPLTPQ